MSDQRPQPKYVQRRNLSMSSADTQVRGAGNLNENMGLRPKFSFKFPSPLDSPTPPLVFPDKR